MLSPEKSHLDPQNRWDQSRVQADRNVLLGVVSVAGITSFSQWPGKRTKQSTSLERWGSGTRVRLGARSKRKTWIFQCAKRMFSVYVYRLYGHVICNYTFNIESRCQTVI